MPKKKPKTLAEKLATVPVAARKETPLNALCAIQALCDFGKSDAEIAEAMRGEHGQWDAAKVAAVIEQEHWRDRSLLTPENAHLAQQQGAIMTIRWERAMKAQARWLALRGMGLASDALDDGNARNFKDAAQGVKLFADVARGELGSGAQAGQGAPSISAFFIVGAGRSADRAKSVKPVEAARIEESNTQAVECFD